ncbi:MAG: hypothetical protein JNM39_18995 [Bdellovibrionaceae bacterium]|nr:hypothetical protein [Pseudobdellovibrionaceae bacterium]
MSGPFRDTQGNQFQKYFHLPFPVTGDERTKPQLIVRLRWLMIISLISLAPAALMMGTLSGLRLSIYFGLILLLVCFNLLTQVKWIGTRHQAQSG